MNPWGLLKVTFSGWLLASAPIACHAESGVDDKATQSISYPTVNPQVSFKSVTELAVTQPNHSIAYGTDALQYGLLWQPKVQTTKPLIVLIHGGCWLNAFGVDHSFPMATALSQAGYPVWSLEYRRTGDVGGGWPGSFYDIKLALGQLNLLHKHHINTNQIILMGHSAGGHLALLAASEMQELNFKQVIGLAAITDISRYALGDNSCQQATQQFMNGLPHEQRKAYQSANLSYHKLPTSVTLLQGDADKIVPVLQSELAHVKRVIVSGAGHFDWVHPGSPAFHKLLELLL